MTTTVELERAGTFEPITYGDFEIENGTSDVRLAPEATITTANSVPVESNQRVRIVIDGVTRFSGRTTSEGTRRRNGQRRVRAEHEAYRVFDEAVSVGPTSDAETVLQDAIAATSFAAGLSVTYTGTSETLTEAYEVTDRKVKSIFRDIVDRTNRVWWIAADGTITVQPRGGRGEWTSVSLPGDDAAIDSYEAGDVRSVLNDVTVVGTGEERVEGDATDAASVSEYGRRSETFNLQYVTTASEADAAAAELLQPTPLDSASVIVGGSVGTNPDQNLANYTISLSDNSFDLAGDSFIIESQSIEQGRVTLEVGEAATNGIDSVNRASKSRADGFEGDQLSKVGGNLDDIDDGTNFGRILQDAIDNGRHTLQEAVGDLDDVADGGEFARIVSSAVENGRHTLQDAVGDLDNIEDGQTFARVNSGNVDADNFVLLATTRGDLDDIDDGADFGKVKTTAIDAGEIILAETNGSLDDIQDGTNFGKVSTTQISGGEIILAETNGDLDDIADGTNFAKVKSTQLSAGEIILAETNGDLDDIADGTNFGKVKRTSLSAGEILLSEGVGDLDDIDDGNDFAKVKTTAVSAGDILLAEAIGDLDDIDDGDQFGKVDLTNITPGGAVFASGVDLRDGRTVDDITATDFQKGGATVIDGDEILTGSIQANEIDTLVLDTDQLKVGFETDTEIEFVENTLGDTAMRPEFDNRGYIGDPSHRFDVGFFNVVDSTAVGTDDLTVNSGGANIVTVFADSGASLRPSVDNESALGTNTAAWATVTAHNIFEQTPEPLDPADPIDGVDLGELKGTSWEHPPAYVAKRKANADDDREYIRQNPKKSGVELGHMTNYLLETCKAQQERIDDLESRLAALESQVGPNA